MSESSDTPRVRNETTDIRLLPVVAVVAALAISLAAAGRAAYWVFHRGDAAEAQMVSHERDTAAAMPEPRLEPLEPKDESGEAFAKREQERRTRLDGRGPTGEAGFVHVPIEQAINQLARQLQSEGKPAELSPKSQGLVAAGEPNSGRILRRGNP